MNRLHAAKRSFHKGERYALALLLGVFCFCGSGYSLANSDPIASGSENRLDASLQSASPDQDLEQQIANLEQQLIAARVFGDDPSTHQIIKDHLNELYARRPINHVPSRHLDQGGDACGNETVISGLPYTDNGSTVGRSDDFQPSCGVANGAPDVIYQFTPISTQQYTVSTCGSSFDTELYIRTGGSCPGSTEIACNDDACGTQSSIVTTLTAGVTYWIIVDGYNSGSGAYSFSMQDQCSVPCQAGDILEATENPADPNFYLNDPDGGCGTPNPVYGTIACGQTVCGLGFNYGSGNHDNDWYRFTVTEQDTVIFTINSEFPMVAMITNDQCGSVVTSGSVQPCQPATLRLECLQPGTYLLLCMPSVNSGVERPRHYRVTMDCHPCQLGRCCYGSSNPRQCATVIQSECWALSGRWRSDVTCSDHPCVVDPTCTPNSSFSQLPYTGGSTVYQVSENWTGNQVAARYTISGYIGHVRFWGFFAGDPAYVPINAPFRVEYYTGDDSGPFAGPFRGQDLQITGTPVDAYNAGGTVYQGYQFDADISPIPYSDGWIAIYSTGSASRTFLWLESSTLLSHTVQRQNGAWVRLPTYIVMSLCLSPSPCDPATQSCPGKTIPSLPYYDRSSAACGSQSTEFCGNALDDSYNIYSLQLPTCQTVTVDLCDFGYVMGVNVRTAGNCPGDSSIVCQSGYCNGAGNNQASFVAWANQTYYIIIKGIGDWRGDYVMNVTGTPWYVPNDSCPGTPITSLPFSDQSNTICARNDVAWSCPSNGAPDANDILYSLNLPTSQRVTASLCGSAYDTGLEVRTGGSCPGVTTVACNDDHPCEGISTVQSQVTFDAQAGQTYYIIVDGYSGRSGPVTLNVTGTPGPDPQQLHVVILPAGSNTNLYWQPVPLAAQYKVYRGNSAGFPLDAAHLLATTPDTFFVDAGILNTADAMNFYVVTLIVTPPPALQNPPETIDKKRDVLNETEIPTLVAPVVNEERAPANKRELINPQQK